MSSGSEDSNCSDGASSSDDSGTDYDEIEDDDVILNLIWSDGSPGLKRIDFLGNNRLNVPIPGEGLPIDWFNLLVDEAFLEFICTETNKNALEVFSGPNTNPQSRMTKWKDVTVPELKTFLGLLCHTGTIRLNKLQDYWKTHYLFGLPCFRNYMSRDRFLLILRCLHFSSAATPTPVSPTAKVNTLVDYFNSKMLTIYSPGKELSVDEPMVLWRGSLSFRHHKQSSRTKLFSVIEPEGLTIKFVVYAGGQGHTSKVVLGLLEGLLDKGHSVFTHEFYNSFALSFELLSRDTYCTGRLRADQKLNPATVTSAVLKRNETIAQYAEGVIVAKWKDGPKRNVLYISTEFENDMVTVKNKRGEEKQKPLPIVQYKAHMKSVQRMDQMLSYYPCKRKNLRWEITIFVHVLQTLLINAFHLHKRFTGGHKMSLYAFRLRILECLLPPRGGVDRFVAPARAAQHRIAKSEALDARGGAKRKRCRECFKAGKKLKRTTYHCEVCPDKPGLCPGKCFDTYHQNLP